MKAVRKITQLKLKPTPGYVLLLPLTAESKTASGIYLPDSASEKPQKGRVLAVGDAETLDNGQERKAACKVGDVIFYKKWGGSEVKVDGVEYLFAKFEDILAVEI